MADSYKFQIGDIVTSTKFMYLIKNRGIIPDGRGASRDFDGQTGYQVFNLTTKAEYWTARRLAHEKYKLKSSSKAGQVLFG